MFMKNLKLYIICTITISVFLFFGVAHAQSNGSLKSFGDKWGWSGTNEAFVPQLVMYASPSVFYNNPGKIDTDINEFIVGHGFTGFHVGVFCAWFDINQDDCRNIQGSNPSYDQRTFDALKMLIQKTKTPKWLLCI